MEQLQIPWLFDGYLRAEGRQEFREWLGTMLEVFVCGGGRFGRIRRPPGGFIHRFSARSVILPKTSKAR